MGPNLPSLGNFGSMSAQLVRIFVSIGTTSPPAIIRTEALPEAETPS